MKTIKANKEMNLPQLIEWGSKNEVVSKEYRCNEDESKSVIFSISGSIYFTNFKPYSIRDTFTVEEKIEITEDTELEYLLEVDEFGNMYKHYFTSITNEKRDCSVEFHTLVNSRLVLIWSDGKLVE